MPNWIQQFISFLKANESLLSSVSNFIAIAATMIGAMGFIFGWWKQLWRQSQKRKGKDTGTEKENSKTGVTIPSSSSLPSIVATPQPYIVDEVKQAAGKSTFSIAGSNIASKLTPETEVYLEQLEADVLEGFRADQYIDLTVEALASEDGGTLRAVQQALRSTFEINAQAWPTGGDVLPLEQAISNHRLVVLLGDPGGGKTTSLRYMALRQIQTLRNSVSGLVPVWISLGNWSDKDMPVLEFLWREYNKFMITGATSIGDFEKSVENGEFFFLLDGLNELPQRDRPDTVHEERFKEDTKPVAIDKRENDLFVLARSVRSRFLLSCRVLDYAHQAGWHEFRVLPLNTTQIMELAERQLDAQFPVFKGILAKQPSLEEVIQTPFLLRGLIRLIQEGSISGPSDRFELVQFVCQSAVARESNRLQLEPSYLVNALGRLAWQLMDHGLIGSYFMPPRDSSLTLDLPDETEIKAMDAIDWGKSTGLFVPSGSDLDGTPKYRFLHQLIQEALALIYLQCNPNVDPNLRRADALLKIGRAHAEWGLLKEAEDNLQRALELCPITESPTTRAQILQALSDVYREWRRSLEALPLSEQAVQILESGEPSKLLAAACYGLASTYSRLRRSREAERYYRRAYGVYEELGDSSNAAYTSVFGLGNMYSSPWHLYDATKAFAIYQRALDVFQEKKDELGIARVQLRMAHLYRIEANIATSLEFFSKCEKGFEDLERSWLRLEALEYAAILLRDARQHANAIAWGERAQALAEELGALSYQVSILIFIRAWTASYQGKHLESLDWVRQAHHIALQISSPAELLDIYRAGFGTTYWRAKKFSEAAKYFLLYKQEMDFEERIYVSGFYKAAIKWAELLGKHVSTSALARFLTEICWQIIHWLETAAAPTSWLGKQLFRWQWRLHRFVWMRN